LTQLDKRVAKQRIASGSGGLLSKWHTVKGCMFNREHVQKSENGGDEYNTKWKRD